MTDRSKFEQMLEFLIAEEQDKAKELFHQLVVEKSREIYENILSEDFQDLEEKTKDDEEDEEEMDESNKPADDEEMDESFGFAEDEEEMGDEEGEGGDASDDFVNDIEDGGDEEEEGGEDLEDRVVDLEDALDDLRAEFEALMGDEGGDDMGGMDDMGGDDMGGMDDMDKMPEDAFMREYVEKVSAGHGAEKKGSSESNANTSSPVAKKNDMGGTTANIAKGGEGGGKDSGLAKSKTQDMNTGNVNVPGGKAGSAFSKKEPGHGAEKKGSGESAANTRSIIGGK